MDDSPMAVYEEICQDVRYAKYQMIWAVQEPDRFLKRTDIKVIKSDTFLFFYYALKAKVWITNSSMERGLNFKKKNTICLNTWHGTAIKKMGIDIQKDNQSFRSKVNVRADIMLAQSQYDIDTFSHAFELPKSIFQCIGLPRNDVLANYTEKDVERIKREMNLPANKKILLYAPTFREYTKGDKQEVVLNVPMNLQYWQEMLGEQYVILFRAHYEVARYMKIDSCSLFIDVSGYPNLNELMIVSDALISDYSSIFFDYSIMHKPMYCFAYDYDMYMQKRGMYLDLSKELPCKMHKTETELLEEILASEKDISEKILQTEEFQKKFVTEYGNAAKKSCDVLYERLHGWFSERNRRSFYEFM